MENVGLGHIEQEDTTVLAPPSFFLLLILVEQPLLGETVTTALQSDLVYREDKYTWSPRRGRRRRRCSERDR